MGAPEFIAPTTTGGGTPVGGSGTPGTIPVWSSGTTLGDSQLIQSATAIYSTTRNFGVGATAASWNTAIRAIDMRTSALWNYNSGSDSVAYWTVNALTDTSGNVVYKANAAASQYTQIGGAHVWSRAVSGTAGAACAFLESARIDNNGRMIVGTAASPGINNNKIVAAFAGDPYVQWADTASAKGFIAGVQSGTTFTGYSYTGAVGSEVYTHQFLFDGPNKYLNIAAVGGANSINGLKLPATPGNADTQTFDAYNEVTLSSGFVTSGITSTGTIVITARITRYARGFGVHMKVAPSGGASLTFAAGWYVTLTGAPQMPEQGALSAYTTDGVGRVAVQIDGNATPSIAGMTTGNYGALGANVAVICSGFVT